MGNEAIAYGAMSAGVSVVCGYPGTPSSEVLETVAKRNDGSIYVEWSVNEKAAMEIAAGASYCGARVMVTMKQVGLNVATDPLMSLSYIGVKGGLVVLAADDPGPNSSQTEQDTRHFAEFANLPVLDPATPEEACAMARAAFELSEAIGLPVILRPTTRVCHACGTVELPEAMPKHEAEGFKRDSRWVIFPALAYKRHLELEEQQNKIAALFEKSEFNSVSGGGSLGVAASGVSCAYLADVIARHGLSLKIFRVGTPYPFPEGRAAEFLSGLDRVLVLEELDPVVEVALTAAAAKNGLKVEILGKTSGHTPKCGEYSYEIVEDALLAFCGLTPMERPAPAVQELPIRTPVLCAGCPHRASFYAVKAAMKGQKAVFTGDIGCYTLGNAKPLDMVDTCLCMGASITIAQGIARADKNVKLFAFIGDSTFFHTGIPGVVNALYNGAELTIVVLDNSTTAMTGHQPHPGIGRTMMGTVSQKIDIVKTLEGLGVPFVRRINPFDQRLAVETLREASQRSGVSAIVFQAPCIALFHRPCVYEVDSARCIACGKCMREIGCPAMYIKEDRRAAIDGSLCYGCGLCAGLCSAGAIGKVEGQ
ncbi:MAG: indolepyruvate ferredoxin oxidoreductase subunit alpha [Clostridia bacterium]|nr:indolepyruvate ferredoxin oxidoreductase subunit alpha [Clostridia bacterium]